MGPIRPRTALVLAAAVALTVASVAPVRAEEPRAAEGLGSSEGSASVLSLSLGDGALDLRLLGEDSSSSNDPDGGGPLARERVVPLDVGSTLVPGLSAAKQPTIETSSTSGEHVASTPGVDLGSLVAGLPVPGLLSGTIDPVALRSLVDESGALSQASGALRDLGVLGGLLTTGTAGLDLGSSALVTDAGAVRGLELDRIEVLDLSALLDALGISLADLPLDAAIDLLAGLGLPLPGGLSPDALLVAIDGLLDETGPVRAQVSALQGQIDALQAQVAPLTSQLSDATALVTSLTSELGVQQALLGSCGLPVVCAPIQALVTSLTSQLASATASVASIDGAIDALQAQVDALLDQVDDLLDTVAGALADLLDLLDGILDGLDGAPLVVVEDLAVGLMAVAGATLDESVAEVTGSVGQVRIGDVALGGLDPSSALGQVTALSEQVTGALGGILALVDPALGELVDIELLDQATSLTEADGVTSALAGITGLRLTVTPPDVCALLERLGAQDTLGSLLGGLGEALPSLPGPVGEVLGDLGSTVACSTGAAAGTVAPAALVDGIASALSEPLSVEALSLTGAATYAGPDAPVQPAPSSPTGPTTPTGRTPLPRTGGDAQLAVLALVFGVAGLGARRLIARTA